jgi:hypothetical protein
MGVGGHTGRVPDRSTIDIEDDLHPAIRRVLEARRKASVDDGSHPALRACLEARDAFSPGRLSSSYHETGHLICAIALGRPFHSIEVGEKGGGAFLQVPPPRGGYMSSRSVAEQIRKDGAHAGSDRVLNDLIIDVGGIVAQLRYPYDDPRYSRRSGPCNPASAPEKHLDP